MNTTPSTRGENPEAIPIREITFGFFDGIVLPETDYQAEMPVAAAIVSEVANQRRDGFEADTPQVSCAVAAQLADAVLPNDSQYSRKVFMGGLPPKVDVNCIQNEFKQYGSLIVDWPGKSKAESPNPPNRFAFLIFDDERSVHNLMHACWTEDLRLYYTLVLNKWKKVIEIRPWLLADAYYAPQPDIPHNKRNTVFVGGAPRSLKAQELAAVMQSLFGHVYSVSIDNDPELKYPKCAARVCFVERNSFLDCIATRHVKLNSTNFSKRVEIKPNVLSDQVCEHCTRAKHAPFFCAYAPCLDYFCFECWISLHADSGCRFFKPLIKCVKNLPRGMPYLRC